MPHLYYLWDFQVSDIHKYKAQTARKILHILVPNSFAEEFDELKYFLLSVSS